MKQLAPLEDALAKVHKDLPHVPVAWTKWLVENAWWLVIIGVAIGGIALVAALFALLAGSLFVGALIGAAFGGLIFVAGVVKLAVLGLTVLLEALAIKPLKAMQKKGWDLLFLTSLVGMAGTIVMALFDGPFAVVTTIVWTAVWGALSLYVLFELRLQYVGKKVAPEAKVVPPKADK